MFTRLSIKAWRQFSDIDILFHEHLTVLTGANGAGKTTVLNSSNDTQPSKNKLGELEFSDGTIGNLLLPTTITNGTYGVEIKGGKTEKGVYVNSHRPNFPYKAVKSIPTSVATRQQIYNKYNEFNKTFIFDTF